MATRYWRGGAGTWNTTTTNWSATAGGGTGATAPGANDVAIIDDASGSGAFTINRTATSALQAFHFLRTTGVVTLTGSSSFTLSGGTATAGFAAGLTIASGAALAWDNTGTVNFTGSGSLSMGGITYFQSPIAVNGAGIAVTLASNSLTFKSFSLSQGTLNIATFSLTCASFVSGATGSRSMTFGTGGVLILDTNAVGVALDLTAGVVNVSSGTPNFQVKSYNQTQIFNTTGATGTPFNMTGLAFAGGAMTAGTTEFTGPFGSIDLTNLFRWDVSAATSLRADLVIPSSVNFTSSAGSTLTFNGSASQSITTNGKTTPFSLVIACTGTNFTFNDTYTSTGGITHSGTASVLQGPSTAINITADTLTRSGTNTWNTRGGAITVTGNALSIATGCTFTSSAAIAFSGATATAARTVSVANPATGSPTVNLTLSAVSGSITFTATVLNSLNTAGFTGTVTGNLTAYSNATLTGITVTGLALSLFVGTGNTASHSLSGIASFSCGSGTVNLSLPTGSLSALLAVGGTINVSSTTSLLLGTVTVNSGAITASATGAITVTSLALNGGSFNLSKNTAVSGTLTFNSGSLVLNGFTATVGTVNFASTVNDINSISAGVVATNLSITGTGEFIFAANASLSGNITVANGTLRLAGFTASCVSFLQTGGAVNFGSGGAVKAATSLNVTGGSSTGDGSLFLEGATASLRSISGAGYTMGVIVSDASGSPGVTVSNATVTSLNTSALLQPIDGTIFVKAGITLGNHVATGLNITAVATGAVLATTTLSRPVGSLTIPINCACTLGSSVKVSGATSITDGSTLALAGYTLETRSFLGQTSATAANCTLSFGTSGFGKLRINNGAFSVSNTPAQINVIIGYDGESGAPQYGDIPGRGGTEVTGTGTVELAGTSTNNFDANVGSYANVTLNLATSVTSMVATGGSVLGNITNSATGMDVRFKGTGAAASTVNAFNLQQCLIGTAVPGVRQDLIYNGAGTINIYNNLVTGINASPVSTWFAQGINGCLDGGNNAGIAFGSAYTGPRSDQPVYVGKRRFYV